MPLSPLSCTPRSISKRCHCLPDTFGAWTISSRRRRCVFVSIATLILPCSAIRPAACLRTTARLTVTLPVSGARKHCRSLLRDVGRTLTMAEAEENLTPAEIRRRKILARGADRLSKITGQTTADTQYAEANAPAADAQVQVGLSHARAGAPGRARNSQGFCLTTQESFVLQVPSDNPLDAWMNSAGPAPEAERDAAGAGADAGPGAAPAGSRPSASKSGPSLPPKRVGAAAVAAKSGDDIGASRDAPMDLDTRCAKCLQLPQRCRLAPARPQIRFAARHARRGRGCAGPP